MWDIYNDDESFQRIARGRGYHDAKLLAKVLYGKQAKRNLNQNEKLEAKSSNTKKLNVHFCQNVGKLVLDSAMLSEEEHENDFDFMWRTQDYSFQTIKIIERANPKNNNSISNWFCCVRLEVSHFFLFLPFTPISTPRTSTKFKGSFCIIPPLSCRPHVP